MKLIKRLGSRLALSDWIEIDLTLRQFGFPWSHEWEGNKREYTLWHLEQGTDQALTALATYLTPGGGEGDVSPTEGPWEGDDFRLFLSHVSAEKEFAGALKHALASYGICGFVAHDDIAPTQEWLDVIDLGLRSCDALAAILSAGFKESDWTDQEVGYVVARRALIIPIHRGVVPYGFISRYQALKQRTATPDKVAAHILDILIKHDLTSARMSEALVAHLATSTTYKASIETMKLIKAKVETFTPSMLRTMEQAVEKNRQVSDAYTVPESIQAIIERERQ